jgi:hypothetical protein
MRFTGLQELQDQLRNLPASLTQQAGAIVVNAANRAIASIQYPGGPGGELQAGLRVDVASEGAFGARAIAKNTSKLAYIFEHGTAIRHTIKGALRGEIHEPSPGNYFIPPVARSRRQMYDELKAMLAENGLGVKGDTP